MESRTRPKTQAQLNQQVFAVSSALGTEIVQPSSAGIISELPTADLKRRFPIRWKYYVDALRAEKSGTEPSTGRFSLYAERLKMLNRLDGYIQHHEEVPEDRVLRPRQIEAVEALRDQMESGRIFARGHFRLPTRFGKTVLFSELIKALDVKTLVVVPTLQTGVQAEDELIERVDPAELGRVFGGKRERARQITITTYQSLLNDLTQGRINPREYELVILDEAHLALTDARKRAVDQFIFALKLGFTATPKYSEGKQVKTFLYPEVYGMSTKEAVQEGILAPFTAYESRFDTGVDLSGIRVASDGDYDEKELAQAVNREARNQAAVKIYQRKEFSGKPAFVFCAGIAHATSMAEVFRGQGIAAEVISGKDSLQEQEAKRKRFKDGEITVLCSADLLTTGINEPRVEICINARPTLSAVMAEQRGGRVLTLDPSNPGKRGYIIDIVDKNSRGILYGDVVEGRAEAQAVIWGKGRRQGPHVIHDGLEKRIEIRGLKVTVSTKEMVTILEDLARITDVHEQYTTTRRISAETLVNLLGKPAETVAAGIPYYFRGKRSSRVDRILEQPLQALRAYDSEFNPDVELPLSVFQEMVVDTVFQRLYTDTITQEIPGVISGIAGRLQPAARALPQVAERLVAFNGILTQLRRPDITPDERVVVVEDFERNLKAFIRIKEELSLQAKDKDSQEIHHNLNEVRAYLVEYRDSEQRSLMRRRIRKVMQEDPILALNFLNAREDYQGTDFYKRIEDIVDPTRVQATLEHAVVGVLMERGLPENVVAFSREVEGVLTPLLGNMNSYGSRLNPHLEELRRQVGSADRVQAGRERRYETTQPLFTNLSVSLGNIMNAISFVVDDYAKSKNRTVPEEAMNRLRQAKKALSAHFNNAKILRDALRRALAEEPELTYEVVNAYNEGRSTLNTRLVDTVRRNPNFVTLRLRQVQNLPDDTTDTFESH